MADYKLDWATATIGGDNVLHGTEGVIDVSISTSGRNGSGASVSDLGQPSSGLLVNSELGAASVQIAFSTGVRCVEFDLVFCSRQKIALSEHISVKARNSDGKSVSVIFDDSAHADDNVSGSEEGTQGTVSVKIVASIGSLEICSAKDLCWFKVGNIKFDAGDTDLGKTNPSIDTEEPSAYELDILDLTKARVEMVGRGRKASDLVTFVDGTVMTFAEIRRVIPCFTPGTTIATVEGERLVEEIRAGDRVITRDNGIQDVAWVGYKTISMNELVTSPQLRPIQIKAGALGENLPNRDMIVSPNHRILVASEMAQLYFEESEVFVTAKDMQNKSGVSTVKTPRTTYIHFMFEHHEVVLANGIWTESFQPGIQNLRGIGAGQRRKILSLFPELATDSGLKSYQTARKSLKKHEAKILLNK